ncbi:MAG: hypothetical protein P8Z37_02540 [Acidobacteriota bacterium]
MAAGTIHRLRTILLLMFLTYGCAGSGEKDYVIFNIGLSNEGLAATTDCLETESCDWLVEEVDSWAVDPDNAAGSVNVSYGRMESEGIANNVLKYATREADGKWTIETADSGGVGWYSSIEVDSFGTAYISYYDIVNHSLKYVTNANGFWLADTIDSISSDTGQVTSLVLDSYRNVHITYYDFEHGSLRYATNAFGLWAISTIDQGGNTGWASSLAIDKSVDRDRLHAVYMDDRGILKYATKTSNGIWNISSIDSIGSSAELTGTLLKRMVSIDVDADGYVHIGYYDIAEMDLKYATNATGSWITSTVDSTGDVGNENSIVTFLNGNQRVVLIFYLDAENGKLKYALNKAGGSGDWVTHTLPIPGSSWEVPSVSVSEDTEKIHVTAIDQLNNRLIYISPIP